MIGLRIYRRDNGILLIPQMESLETVLRGYARLAEEELGPVYRGKGAMLRSCVESEETAEFIKGEIAKAPSLCIEEVPAILVALGEI